MKEPRLVLAPGSLLPYVLRSVTMSADASASRDAPPRLGMWDAVSIIVGIIVGVGIFKAPATVFQNASGPAEVLLVWVIGAVPSLLGALCYAELASTYPRSGGEYVYLTRSFGSWLGFLFAWAQLIIIRPAGGIAMPAYILAEAATNLWGLSPGVAPLVAVSAIMGLTLINILGVTPGKWAQNFLTLTKVVCLGGIIVAGFCLARPPASSVPPATTPAFFVMMMAVVYTFDGWNEAAYVAHEVRNPRRNLPRALILGTLAVTLLYLLVNLAYIVGLGFDGARALGPGPADLLSRTFGAAAGNAMNLLIIVSVLGALSGMIFTGARIFSEMGSDHRLFAPLGWWSARWRTPVCSLLVQAGLNISTVLAVGVIWKNKDGFDTLLRYSGPVFYLFFLLTGLSVFLLRWRDPDAERPFRVPLYPLTPLLFCGWCGFMLFGSLKDAWREGLVGLGILALGLPLYLISRQLRSGSVSPLAGPHCLSRQWSKELHDSNVES